MPQMADIRNRMAPVVSLAKNCNQASHEGSFVDLAVFTGVKKCIFVIGAATGTPDSFSHTLSVRENTTQDSSGDTEMAFTDEVSGVSASTKVVTAAGVYVLHCENTKRYAAALVAATFANGSSPASPITAIFIGEQERF